jgi:lipopolysaccharide export system protein LptA
MERRSKKMNKVLRISLFILVLIITLFFFSPLGETQEKKEVGKSDGKEPRFEMGFGFTSSRAPIYIDSDTLEASQKENTVTYKGNVVAKQEDKTLYANTLVINYDSDTKKIKQVIAMGNVKIVQLERKATSQKAIFHQDENKVVLDGDAVVRDGKNVIRGEKVIFYVDEQRSVVEGGKGGRVSTMITPPPKEEGEEKKPKEGKKK